MASNKSAAVATANDRDESSPNTVSYRAPFDLVEQKDELLLRADLPGVLREDLALDFHDGLLTLTGKVKRQVPPDADPLLVEYGVGDFVRSLRIETPVDAERITAELDRGVLTVHLPRTPESLPRRIAIEPRKP